MRHKVQTATLAAGILIAIVLSVFAGVSVANADHGAIEVCHVPPGNPAGARTVVVDHNAWQEGTSAHSSHELDYLGTCENTEPTETPTNPPPTETPTDEPLPPTETPTEPPPTPTDPPPTETPTPDPCGGECEPTPTPPPPDGPGPIEIESSHSSHIAIPFMWLLTNETDGRWCVLIAESHPSVERQNIKCFEDDPDWVADNAPCAGPVYDTDVWVCDYTSYEWREARWPDAPWVYEEIGRLPLAQLMTVYQNHVDQWGPNHE